MPSSEAEVFQASSSQSTDTTVTTSNDNNSKETKIKKRKPGSPGMYQRIEMPTPESMAQEDFMNNCAVRTILSGVMGSGLGVVFGIFMGTMDTSVRN